MKIYNPWMKAYNAWDNYCQENKIEKVTILPKIKYLSNENDKSFFIALPEEVENKEEEVKEYLNMKNKWIAQWLYEHYGTEEAIQYCFLNNFTMSFERTYLCKYNKIHQCEIWCQYFGDCNYEF